MIAIVFVIFSAWVFQYITWRRLSKEYHEKSVLSTYIWITPIVFLLAARLGQVVFVWNPWELRLLDIFGFWRKAGFDLFWGYLSLVIFSMFFAYKNKIKVWTFLEDMWASVWVFLSLWIGFLYYQKVLNLKLLVIIIVNMVVVGALNWILAGKYRSFRLYPSGKKGFLFWFGQAVLGMGIGGGMAYFRAGNLLVAGSLGVLSIISWFGLYFLGKID